MNSLRNTQLRDNADTHRRISAQLDDGKWFRFLCASAWKRSGGADSRRPGGV